ncbi:beta-propeller fold lactonase family protein, partial [Candidatus Gracilibacteria bacterium]|nr:beta-propeller fold lactonase family protein [Candidatus Gracilibacteria bacterium]
TIAGGGAITTTGGTGGGYSAGTGGGGRIALYYNTKTYTGTVTSTGGNAGTIYEETPRPFLISPTSAAVTYNSAVLGATIVLSGSTVTTERGTCLGTSPLPTGNCLAEGATSTGAFTHLRTGLSESTTYYYRGYATNSNGTSYSPDGTFTTDVSNKIINSNTTWEAGTYNYVSVTVTNGATLTLNSTTTGTGLTATGTGVTINATNITIDAGSSISANGKGFTGNNGPGKGNSAGCTATGSGGAGHGGTGGNSGGVTYGSSTQPTTLGSGGGSNCAGGGGGGGAIKIIVSGTFINNGSTTANGNSATSYDAGGSGGSIWIDAGTIAGSGAITVNGGSGYDATHGGGGGGGRIALYYDTYTYTGTTTAAGGGISSYSGGAGTVYNKDKAGLGNLTIAGGGATRIISGETGIDSLSISGGNTTTFTSGDYTYGILTISGSGNTVTLNSIYTSSSTLNIGSGSTLNVPAGDWSSLTTITGGGNFILASGSSTFSTLNITGTSTLTLNSTTTGTGLTATGTGVTINATNITVDAGSSISANGKGFTGNNGPGKGASQGCTNNLSGGAGHGGTGGNTGGITYGSSTEPVTLGSGGGSNCGTGGTGAGAMKFVVSGTFTNNGSTTANGNSGISWDGGGSGGSIWIDAGTIAGSGAITANGGHGGYGTTAGGGGAGGRIALYYNTKTLTGTTTTTGGIGRAPDAGAGTIYLFSRAPTLETPTVSSITYTTATFGATITLSGLSVITDRGTCWGTTAYPTSNCLSEGATSTGVFTQARSSLPAGTLIYYRGYATNSYGTAYSPDGSTTTISYSVPTFATSTIITETLPQGIVISPDGTSVYVTNNTSNTVSQYTRSTSTGDITALATSSIVTGTGPRGIAISPDGASVYVTNDTSNSISQYSRNTSTGELTVLSPATVSSNGVFPRGIIVSSDGASVYVTNYNSTNTAMFSRNVSSGLLTALGVATTTTGANPRGIAISPDDTSVYVTNSGSNTVSQYSRNLSTGDLTLLATSTVVSGMSPIGVVVSPNNDFVYVTNNASNTISIFTRDISVGFLTLLSSSTIQTNIPPSDINITSDGTSAYVVNSSDNTISQYSRDVLTGTLNTLNTLTITTGGSEPYGVFISADGLSVYTTNSSSSNISKYSRNTSTGELTPLGTPMVSSTTPTQATFTIAIVSDGDSTITARGTCWGTTAAPVTNCLAEGGTATGTFSQTRTGLTASTTYYVRAYATNGVGTSYSADSIITTPNISDPTQVTLSAASGQITTSYVTPNDANLNSIVVLKSTSPFYSAEPLSYATWNPADKGSGVTLSNGNLTWTSPANYLNASARATIGKSSGKWYWEFRADSGTSRYHMIGIADAIADINTGLGGTDPTAWTYYAQEGRTFHVGRDLYWDTWTNGDIIGIAMDMDADIVYWYKNNVLQGSYTGITGTMYPLVENAWTQSSVGTANFGATAFVYPVPSGYNAGVYSGGVSVVPTNGTTYTVGDTIGSATVACIDTTVTSLTSDSCVTTGLTDGTQYYFKVFAKNNSNNYSQGVFPLGSPATPSSVTSIANGSDPVSVTIAPGGTATFVDSFTLQTSTTTDVISSITVALANASSTKLIEITDDTGTTVYGSTTNPTGNTAVIALNMNTLTADITSTQYKIRITPKTQTELPVGVLGTLYPVTAYVSSWAGTKIKSGADTSSATVTIDNLPPGVITSDSITQGSTRLTFNYTLPIDSDLSSVVILVSTSTAVTNVPVDGMTYTSGDAVGADTVGCVDIEGTPSGLSSCVVRGLVNGTSYYFKVFTSDTKGNYSQAMTPADSPATPNVLLTSVRIASYLLRNDDGGESVATNALPENTSNPSNFILGDKVRIRFTVSNETALSTTKSYQIEYATGTCTAAWTAVPRRVDTRNQPWRIDPSTYVANSATTSHLASMSVPVGKTFTSGRVQTFNKISQPITLLNGEYTEIEFLLRSTSNLVTGTTYCLRLTNSGEDSDFIYSSIPQIMAVSSIYRNQAGGGGGGGSSAGVIRIEENAIATTTVTGGGVSDVLATSTSVEIVAPPDAQQSTTTPTRRRGGGGSVGLLGDDINLVYNFTDSQVLGETSAPICTDMKRHMEYGRDDSTTQGEVSQLQFFLKQKGYFNYKVTGNYFEITREAVKGFQRDNNLIISGIAGKITREKMREVGCVK